MMFIDATREMPMPAYCHDDRPPLFARGTDQDDRPRLPEPLPPPWLNCSTPPAEFYRPIYQRPRAPGWRGAATAVQVLVWIATVTAVMHGIPQRVIHRV
jgi:hypothetical protein